PAPAAQVWYKSPLGPKESQGSAAKPRFPPLHTVSPGITTCCHFFPPSRLTALPMALYEPPIQATTIFFGLAGLTAREHSFSLPVVMQATSASGSERSITGPRRKSLASAGLASRATN